MKLWAFGLIAGVAAVQSAGTPVKKVISMLSDMEAKGKQAMADEANVYAEYSEWVRTETRDTNLAIGANKEEIAKQEGIKAKAEGDAAQFADELAALNGELASFTAELDAATAQRKSENEEFLTTEQDYSESVDALGRAIGVLKSKADAKFAELKFLQTPTLLAKSPELLSLMQQPQASSYAYEGQSGGIVAVLEGLNEKFSKELSDLQKAEANAEHAYQLMKLNLDDEITNTNNAIANRQAKLGEAKATAAKATGDLATANSELAANQKYVKDINATFSVKSSTFENNQAVRTDELKAIGTAIEILSGDALGMANKHAGSGKFRPGTEFIQLKSKVKALTNSESAGVLKQVASMLQERDSEMGGKSKFLSMAAVRMLNGASTNAKGVFDKVINMIQELLTRLEEEAAAEAEHKAFCDKELKENKLKREAKSQKVDELTAKSAALNSEIAAMSEKIATLAKEQSELAAAMAEATTIRTKEKATNEETVSDAKAAQVAVGQALAVLKEFYGGAALLQTKQVPEMAAYGGMTAGSKGVVGMLEVIQTDFARLESETAAEESSAAAEYESFMEESTALKKEKHDDEFKTSLEKDKAQHELKLTTKELKLTQEELTAAMDYHEQLKGSCIEVKVSYEERVAMREQEIASLKEALEVLDAHSASESYKGF